jgi:hypothetical protein
LDNWKLDYVRFEGVGIVQSNGLVAWGYILNVIKDDDAHRKIRGWYNVRHYVPTMLDMTLKHTGKKVRAAVFRSRTPSDK